MAWDNAVITNAGIALYSEALILNSAQAGVEGGNGLTISNKAKGGSSTYPAASLMAQSQITAPNAELDVIRVSDFANGKRIDMRITNQNVQTAYMIKQIGIFAGKVGGSDNELLLVPSADGTARSSLILLAIIQDETGVKIPAFSENPEFIFEVGFLLPFSNELQITLDIQPSVFVTNDELQDALKTKLDTTATAESAKKLSPGSKINNVVYTGEKDITVYDDTKLPLSQDQPLNMRVMRNLVGMQVQANLSGYIYISPPVLNNGTVFNLELDGWSYDPISGSWAGDPWKVLIGGAYDNLAGVWLYTSATLICPNEIFDTVYFGYNTANALYCGIFLHIKSWIGSPAISLTKAIVSNPGYGLTQTGWGLFHRADTTGFSITATTPVAWTFTNKNIAEYWAVKLGVAKDVVVTPATFRDGIAGGILGGDRRSDNQPPSYYYNSFIPVGFGHGMITSFVDCASFGLPLQGNGFASLLTHIPWSDPSGGTIRQVAYLDYSIYYRVSITPNSWGAWRQIIDSDMLNQPYGIPTLDYSGKIPVSQAPQSIASGSYIGNSAVTDIATGAVSNTPRFIPLPFIPRAAIVRNNISQYSFGNRLDADGIAVIGSPMKDNYNHPVISVDGTTAGFYVYGYAEGQYVGGFTGYTQGTNANGQTYHYIAFA